MTPWLTRQVSIGILSSHFNTTIRSRSSSETGRAVDWIGLDIIWSLQAKGSVLTLSHSGTGKQEQTTFTERKRQGNMQDPVVFAFVPRLTREDTWRLGTQIISQFSRVHRFLPIHMYYISKPSWLSRKIVLHTLPPISNPCVIWPNSVSPSTPRWHQTAGKFKLISGYLWTISGYVYEAASFFSPWTEHATLVGNPVIAWNLQEWMNTTANRQYLSRHIPQWPSPSNPHTIYCKTHWNRDDCVP